jgi:Ca2+-binding EF-hand superfamily protein
MSQINRVQNCFELLDDNKDGVISKDELENAVKVLAVGKEKNIEKSVDCIMQLVDTDNSETTRYNFFNKRGDIQGSLKKFHF